MKNIIVFTILLSFINCNNSNSTKDSPESSTLKNKNESKVFILNEDLSEDKIIGTWLIKWTGGGLLDPFYLTIYKDNGVFYERYCAIEGYKEKPAFDSDKELRKEGNKYFRIDSRVGDYVFITKNGLLEHYDNEGKIEGYKSEKAELKPEIKIKE